MPALTFPYDKAGKPRGAKFADGSDLQCPANHGYTTDDALGTLERVTNNVLKQGMKDWRTPSFPLSKMAVKAASSQTMSNNSRTKTHVFYPNVKRTKFYNPMPGVVQYDVTRELIESCGGSISTAQMVANSNSLGCAPPRGDRGISGKDRYYQNAVTGVFELGPFCVTNYLDLEDFAGTLEAYKKAAINAGGLAMEYERMRQFVSMSRYNTSAVAGTISPIGFSGHYGEMPNSAGSLEWILRAIEEGIGGEVDSDVPVVVECSSQLRKFWINDYSRRHGVQIQESLGGIAKSVAGYIASFEGTDDFAMTSLRTNRRVTFRVSKTPVYTEVYPTGTDLAEWDFQDYFVTQPGSDTQSGQANGFRQSKNVHYGDPSMYCDGAKASSRLCEQIFIHTDRAFHYEAFPTNPLGTSIGKDVETNMNNLWSGTQISWMFGADVELYYLNQMNRSLADTGYPLMSNIDNTWFAGRLKFGHQFIEDEPLEMMSILVRVPMDESPLAETTTLVEADRAAPITISTRPAKAAPEFCDPIPAGSEPDEETEGLAWTPARLEYHLPASGTITVVHTLQRTGGVNGTLTLPFTVTEGTALEGSAVTHHFTRAAGNVVFADGEDTATLSIVLRSIARESGDPCFVNATIVWDNSPVVLNTGAYESTALCLKLYEAAVAEDPAACTECE